MERTGKRLRSEEDARQTLNSNRENKNKLSIEHEEAVSTFLKVKPEPKKNQILA
jgi:hypothetical protein